MQASAMKADHAAPEMPHPARVPKTGQLQAQINRSSSSAELNQRLLRGFFLCIYIYIQMQMI